MVEQEAVNFEVASSSLAGGAINKKNALGALFLLITFSSQTRTLVRPDDEANRNRELARDFLSEEERKAFVLAKA